MNRSSILLFVGSVIGGFTVQMHWGVRHTIAHIDIRIWVSVVVLWGLFWLVRKAVRVAAPQLSTDFEEAFSEFYLLLAVTPAFLMIDNSMLRTVAVVGYLVLVAVYAVRVLKVRWVMWIWQGICRIVHALRRAGSGSGISVKVRDDRKDNALEVVVRGAGRSGATAAALKTRLVELYEDLPDVAGYQRLVVDIRGLTEADGGIWIVFGALASYARLMGIDDLVVVGTGDQHDMLGDKIQAELPAYRFEQVAAG